MSVSLLKAALKLSAAALSALDPLVPLLCRTPDDLQEDFFLADVERALATAEGFLQEGAQ
ncbi:hypothetical protein ACGFZK_09020 [Streptomyces sp. NPDC048257]|uniref:hypothetical protein n=1 Tax=Streptomyces sp. NPDC048257 TaxID=3365526 RepID=UPI00371EEAF1